MRLFHRTDPIDRVSDRIERLRDEATRLLEREQELVASIETLRTAADDKRGRLRRRRIERKVMRAEHQLEQVRAARVNLSDAELRAIMTELQDQSRHTRERLDQALEQLAPVEAEWDRLRSTFDALADAVSLPALEPIAGQVGEELEIPEFPIQRTEGYAKPFPQSAVVF